MDMLQHPIKQEIDLVDVGDLGEGHEYYQFGKRGITRIEACEKAGEFSHIPYIRVWKGEKCLAEFCQHKIIGITFNTE